MFVGIGRVAGAEQEREKLGGCQNEADGRYVKNLDTEAGKTLATKETLVGP